MDRPSRWLTEPYAILATAVLCAASDPAAEDLVRCTDLAVLRFGQGLRDLPMPSIEEARAYAFDADEDTFRAASRGRLLAGGSEHVGRILTEMVTRSGADEVMVTNAAPGLDDRLRALELLASP